MKDESGKDGLATLNSVNESGVAVAAKLELLTRSIETIRRGDRVLGKDQHDPSAPVREYVVEETYVRTIDHLRLLTIRDSAGVEQTIKTTDDHPFYIVGERWANACKLVPGDRLLEPDGSESEVVATAREEHPEGVTVYNFRVGEAHTYFVRQEGSTAGAVWVHNAGSGYASSTRAPTPSEFEKLAFGHTGRKTTFSLPWSHGRSHKRIADDFSLRSGTLKEATLLPWSRLNLNDVHSTDFKRFSQKLAQATSDGWLLKNDPRVKKAIWYGVEALPTSGRAAELTRLLNQNNIIYRVVKLK